MPLTSKQKWLSNLIFLLASGGLLVFLLNAPEETTKKLPVDDIHLKFQTMDRKEAEKSCEKCHNPEGEVPLPEGHPPKYRCLFCHKQVK
jgi:hypothetical protein